jgi:hypothetical protein
VWYRRCVGLPGGRGEANPERPGARGEQIRVAGKDEFHGPVGERRGKRELRADARGLAGRDDNSFRLQGFLIST